MKTVQQVWKAAKMYILIQGFFYVSEKSKITLDSQLSKLL